MRAALPYEIKTARLHLRPVAAADQAFVVDTMNDLAVSGWLSSVPHPYAVADFDHFLTQIATPGRVFAIDDEVGFAGVVGLDVEFGYWLTPRSQGLGYATEASRALLAGFFAANDLAVLSGYFEGNTLSARVLTKLGFVKCGRGSKMCRAFGVDRGHVNVALSQANFIASHPIAARSARLWYRDLQPFDAEALHEIVSNWDVVRQLGSFPWPADPAFTATRAMPYSGDGFAWGVHLAGALIGTVAVTKGELGYMIAPAQWGKGFATEACRFALTHAFEILPLDEITAGVWADNAASRGLLTKLGFEGTAETNEMSKARGVMADGFDIRLTRERWFATSGA